MYRTASWTDCSFDNVRVFTPESVYRRMIREGMCGRKVLPYIEIGGMTLHANGGVSGASIGEPRIAFMGPEAVGSEEQRWRDKLAIRT